MIFLSTPSPIFPPKEPDPMILTYVWRGGEMIWANSPRLLSWDWEAAAEGRKSAKLVCAAPPPPRSNANAHRPHPQNENPTLDLKSVNKGLVCEKALDGDLPSVLEGIHPGYTPLTVNFTEAQ